MYTIVRENPFHKRFSFAQIVSIDRPLLSAIFVRNDFAVHDNYWLLRRSRRTAASTPSVGVQTPHSLLFQKYRKIMIIFMHSKYDEVEKVFLIVD